MTTMVMDTTQTPTDAITRHVVGQVINAIAARDWDSLELTVAADMVYWRPGTSDRVDGATGYVAQWRRFVEETSELSYRPHTVMVQGDTAMVEATAEGRWKDGSRLNYSLVTVMRVAGGRLVEEREYIVPRTQA
ncbi:MAG: nuclear transport factor 2 family protein [Thermoleophilia bacterium]|nr:nuclear transport factor 2 family protein [Thermoleophilia bacterium]